MISLASAFHQVVHNRGHGFSKRFHPAGMHQRTHTHRNTRLEMYRCSVRHNTYLLYKQVQGAT